MKIKVVATSGNGPTRCELRASRQMHNHGTEVLEDSEGGGLRLHQHMDPRGLQRGRAGRRDQHEDGTDANARCR